MAKKEIKRMTKKINSGIFRVWLDRTKNDVTYLNLVMLVYLTIKSGFVIEWWHIAVFILFVILRTIWDHKKVIPEQMDFWIGQSKTLTDVFKKIDRLTEEEK